MISWRTDGRATKGTTFVESRSRHAASMNTRFNACKLTFTYNHPLLVACALMYPVEAAIVQQKGVSMFTCVTTHPAVSFPGVCAPAAAWCHDFLFLSVSVRCDPLNLDLPLCTIYKLHLYRDSNMGFWSQFTHISCRRRKKGVRNYNTTIVQTLQNEYWFISNTYFYGKSYWVESDLVCNHTSDYKIRGRPIC